MKDELERAYYQRAHRDNENFALVWLLKQYYENTIFGLFFLHNLPVAIQT